MTLHLLIKIHLYDSRYHGMGEWRPSPARLFQALVAGVARGALIDNKSASALVWLENLQSPLIGLPTMWSGQRFAQFGPDNDIDSVAGDLRRSDEIRSSKTIEPKLFNRDLPFLYAWAFEEDDVGIRHGQVVCALAERLYQFGRGVDMAWASGEILDDEQFEAMLLKYAGLIYRPTTVGTRTLASPQPGSLDSLKARFAATRSRLRSVGLGKGEKYLFRQPPKPRFSQVAYDGPSSQHLYDLLRVSHQPTFAHWLLAEASRLVVLLRDLAVDRLRSAFPHRLPEIERVVVGRKADGSDNGPTEARIRIIPLPSIGYQHADRQIRRILIQVPAVCPFRADDIHWAFSGLELVNRDTGEVLNIILTPATDDSMLKHYGLTDGRHARVWRSVTPVALPDSVKRRRIDPARIKDEVKGGTERENEQARAAVAVVQALRHDEVRVRPNWIRLQREPFDSNGERVEAFAPSSRFSKERLWHVEIDFDQAIAGPLVIGDGRFLGLGVMAPVPSPVGIHAFAIEQGLSAMVEPIELSRALRRAVMARVQEVLGSRKPLPAFFSGHERHGSAAQTERHLHLTFAFDPSETRLLVLAPYVTNRSKLTASETQHLETLDEALKDFSELRAGSGDRLTLKASSIDVETDRLFASSLIWESVTPYLITRHGKRTDAGTVSSNDLRAECRRLSLPNPHITTNHLEETRVDLVGRVRMTFQVAVRGPLLLGRSRHLGGGLFVGGS